LATADLVQVGVGDPGPSNALTVSGTGVLTAGTGGITVSGNGAVKLSGGTINTSSVSLTDLSQLNWTTGTLNLTAGADFDPAQGPGSTGGIFGPSLTLGANQTLMTTVEYIGENRGSFSLTLNSGSFHYVSAAIVVNPTGTLTLNPGSTLSCPQIDQYGGTINGTLANQALFIYQGGQFTGRLVNQGTFVIQVPASTFTAGSGIENDASITLGAGQTMAANGTGLDNLGTINLGVSGAAIGGTLSGSGPAIKDYGGAIHGPGTISSVFTNYGDLYPNGILRLTNATPAQNRGIVHGGGTIIGNFTNSASGVIQLPYGESLTISNDWINAGSTELFGAQSYLRGGTITNAGGTINGFGVIGATVLNTSGTIQAAQGGTLDITGPNCTNGALGQLIAGDTTYSTTVLRFTSGLATNNGGITLIGGTFDNNNNPMVNNGRITGFGFFRASTLTNFGTVTLTGTGGSTFNNGTTIVVGDLDNRAGGTVNIQYNPAIFSGNVTNNGTIKVTNTTVTFAGNYSGKTYTSDPATNIFQANATITPGGSMTGGVGDRFLINGTFTNAGAYTNNGGSLAAKDVINDGALNQLAGTAGLADDQLRRHADHSPRRQPSHQHRHLHHPHRQRHA
jgi:hypothetical protein